MGTHTEIFAWGANQVGQLGLGSNSQDKKSASPLVYSFSIAIREIACGSEHSLILSEEGQVYSMGSNHEGKLGLGDRSLSQSSMPCLIDGLSSYPIVSVSCGSSHSVALSSLGHCYSWGSGYSGALGTGKAVSSWSPVQMQTPLSVKVTFVSCGAHHTALILDKPNENVLMCGAGEAGQLGNGRLCKEYLPVNADICNVKSIACGNWHTLFLNCRGQVFATGENSDGQLGIGYSSGSNLPIEITYFSGKNVQKIACGQHSACVTHDGQLFIWGPSAIGTFLLPRPIDIGKVKDIDIGDAFGVALDFYGNVHTWGGNDNGELGQGHCLPKTDVQTINALAGKDVRDIVCGGNFCIALGGEKKFEDSDPSHTHARKEITQEHNPVIRHNERDEDRRTQELKREELRQLEIREQEMKRDKLRHQEILRQNEIRQQESRQSEIRQQELLRQKEIRQQELRQYEIRQQELRQEEIRKEDLRRQREQEELRRQREQEELRRQREQEELRRQREQEELRRQREQEEIRRQREQEEIRRQEELRLSQTKTLELQQKQEGLVQYRELSIKYRDLQLENSRLSHQLESSQASSEKELLLLKSAHEAEIYSLRGALEESAQHQRSLETQISSLQSSNNRLQQDLSQALSKVEDSSSYSIQLEQKLERLEEDFLRTRSDLSKQVDSQSYSINDLQDRLHASEKTNSSLRQEIKQLNFVQSDLQSELSRRESLINEYSDKISHLNEAYTKLEASYNGLIRENQILNEDFKDLQAKNQELFLKLDQELSYKAREYKERTISLLNMSKTFESQDYSELAQTKQSRKEIADRHEPIGMARYGRRVSQEIRSFESPSKDLRVSSPSRKQVLSRQVEIPTYQEVQARISGLMDKHQENEIRISQTNH